jgi:hypothetical protein
MSPPKRKRRGAVPSIAVDIQASPEARYDEDQGLERRTSPPGSNYPDTSGQSIDSYFPRSGGYIGKPAGGPSNNNLFQQAYFPFPAASYLPQTQPLYPSQELVLPAHLSQYPAMPKVDMDALFDRMEAQVDPYRVNKPPHANLFTFGAAVGPAS